MNVGLSWNSVPHRHLVSEGFQWSRFEEAADGLNRKYWKRVSEED